MELGVYTFAELSPAQRVRDLMEEIALADRGPRGALLVGSPQEVVDKILFEHEIFGHDRFLAQMSVGTLPHRHVMRSIELFATEVAPQVRKATESRPAAVS